MEKGLPRRSCGHGTRLPSLEIRHQSRGGKEASQPLSLFLLSDFLPEQPTGQVLVEASQEGCPGDVTCQPPGTQNKQ